jgi:hypothetical protein
MNKLYSNQFMREKCIEPVKRNKDGMRWIVHRFPIKGGISWRDVMMKSNDNPLIQAVNNFSIANGFCANFDAGAPKNIVKIRLPNDYILNA